MSRVFRMIFGGNRGPGAGRCDLLDRFLNEPEQMLFDQMAPWDQWHAVDTAGRALEEGLLCEKIRLMNLVKAALLHDIGKVRGEASPLLRLMIGFIRRYLPKTYRRRARRDGTPLERALHMDNVHASRGAYMAEALGTSPEVVDLIRRHHIPVSPGDSLELAILRIADAGRPRRKGPKQEPPASIVPGDSGGGRQVTRAGG